MSYYSHPKPWTRATLIKRRSNLTVDPLETKTKPQPSTTTSLADTSVSTALSPGAIHKSNVLTLYSRLFEAHFLPTHLVLILIATALYDLFCPTFLMPGALRVALAFSGWCRFVGFCLMVYFFYRYEQYHQLCIGMRVEEMREAGLLEDMEETDSDFSPNVFLKFGIVEAMTFPLGGIIYGAMPALQAVLMHLFTERLTYVVSLKPTIWKPGLAA